MTEKEAKKHLRRMLASYSAGSILDLLGSIFRQFADEADEDPILYERFKNVERCLMVVGHGVDAVCPR